MILAEMETLSKCINDNLMHNDQWNENVHKIIDCLTNRQTGQSTFNIYNCDCI
jgi:hypothetical protein